MTRVIAREELVEALALVVADTTVVTEAERETVPLSIDGFGAMQLKSSVVKKG